jgi:hypothetical protein
MRDLMASVLDANAAQPYRTHAPLISAPSFPSILMSSYNARDVEQHKSIHKNRGSLGKDLSLSMQALEFDSSFRDNSLTAGPIAFNASHPVRPGGVGTLPTSSTDGNNNRDASNATEVVIDWATSTATSSIQSAATMEPPAQTASGGPKHSRTPSNGQAVMSAVMAKPRVPPNSATLEPMAKPRGVSNASVDPVVAKKVKPLLFNKQQEIMQHFQCISCTKINEEKKARVMEGKRISNGLILFAPAFIQIFEHCVDVAARCCGTGVSQFGPRSLVWVVRRGLYIYFSPNKSKVARDGEDAIALAYCSISDFTLSCFLFLLSVHKVREIVTSGTELLKYGGIRKHERFFAITHDGEFFLVIIIFWGVLWSQGTSN